MIKILKKLNMIILNENWFVNYKTFKEKAYILYYKIKCIFEIKKNTLKISIILGKKIQNYSLNITH